MTHSEHNSDKLESLDLDDLGLRADCIQHNELWLKLAGDDVENEAELVSQLCDLEVSIAATPCFSIAGLKAKQLVIRRAEFDDDLGVIEEIMRLDAERVGDDEEDDHESD